MAGTPIYCICRFDGDDWHLDADHILPGLNNRQVVIQHAASLPGLNVVNVVINPLIVAVFDKGQNIHWRDAGFDGPWLPDDLYDWLVKTVDQTAPEAGRDRRMIDKIVRIPTG